MHNAGDTNFSNPPSVIVTPGVRQRITASSFCSRSLTSCEICWGRFGWGSWLDLPGYDAITSRINRTAAWAGEEQVNEGDSDHLIPYVRRAR